MTHLYDSYVLHKLNRSLVLVDVFLKKVDNASLQRYGPTYAYMWVWDFCSKAFLVNITLRLFLTRRDSLGKETFHESMEFFLNFQDADIFHFVKTMVKYYREEHPPISTPKAKENEAIFLR